MCGINGFIQFGEQYSAEEMANIVHTMNNKLVHRGPDSEGLYSDAHCALGMRRLAVIDLDSGQQPIWNAAGNKMIIFNGELYNYRDLKEKLAAGGYVFKTKSDTEVALIGYEAYGSNVFSMMEGMFALAIYDTENRQWVFARDRFGEKPFYYYRGEDFFLFSSELKGLLSTGLIPKKIDMAGLSQYFQLTYIPAPGSILEGVRKLPSASCMVVDSAGRETIRQYWKLEMGAEHLCGDYDACKKMLRQALFESVEKRMISDVPLGAFLSGGIDSTIIASVMAAVSSERINTFTIGFKDKRYDESGLAKITADRLHSKHHVLTLDWDNALEDVDRVLSGMGEPFADSSLIATYAVSRMTRQYVTVALTGDAGDELFAGYDKYLIGYYSKIYKSIPRFLRKGVVEPMLQLLPADSHLARKAHKVVTNAERNIYEQRKRLMSLGFQNEECMQLMPRIPADRLEDIKTCYEALSSVDEQTRAQYVDVNYVLEGCMLHKVDRASMMASLETRVPMLDSNVAELAFNMPSEFKIKGKRRKIILKDAFSDMIPEQLLHAPKHGFCVPIASWMRRELRGSLMSFMDEGFLHEQGIFDAGYMRTVAEEHLSGRADRGAQLWTFFVFQNWYKSVFSKG